MVANLEEEDQMTKAAREMFSSLHHEKEKPETEKMRLSVRRMGIRLLPLPQEPVVASSVAVATLLHLAVPF
jgi:hypothetical protein